MANALVKTHAMAGGPVGDLIDLGAYCRQVQITVTAATWVRCQVGITSAPSAPSGTPAPSNGDEAAQGWVKLAANGTYTTPVDPYQQLYRWIEVWELNSGDLVATGSY